MRRQVLTVAWPMILCHVLQTLFHAVDMFWIGRLGVQELAAISWASDVLMVLSTAIVGIAIGTSAIVAHCVGARDYEEASRTAWHSFILGTGVVLLIAVLGCFYIEPALLLLGADPPTAALTTSYLKISFYGSFVLFFMFLSIYILQGASDLKTPMYATVLATCVNFFLDPVLIFGGGRLEGMGIEGAALATVISRSLGTLVCMYAFVNSNKKIHLKWTTLKLNFGIMMRILKVGIPGSIHMSMRCGMALLMVVIVGQFGYKAVAAYGIGIKLLNIAMMPGFGLGAAASILIGQHLGAQRQTMAMQSALLPAFYNAVIMQIVALIYVAWPQKIMGLFTNDFEVIRLGMDYLKVSTIPYFVLGVGFVLGRALNGAGDTSSAITINAVCLWFIQIPLVLFYTHFWEMGVYGIWWAIMLASLFQAGSTAALFFTQEWRYRRI